MTDQVCYSKSWVGRDELRQYLYTHLRLNDFTGGTYNLNSFENLDNERIVFKKVLDRYQMRAIAGSPITDFEHIEDERNLTELETDIQNNLNWYDHNVIVTVVFKEYTEHMTIWISGLIVWSENSAESIIKTLKTFL